MTLEMTSVRVLGLAIGARYLGSVLAHRVPVLGRYSIPPSVTGGLLVAALIACIQGLTELEIVWNLALRDELLLVFFSSVGLSAKWSKLKQGGPLFGKLALFTVLFLIVQNLAGVLFALAMGRDAAYGFVCGSVSFAGGHGTAVTWGTVAAEWGYDHVMAHALAFATLGLVAGGLVGGPWAAWLIKKRGLAEPRVGADGTTEPKQEVPVEVTSTRVIRTVFVYAVCVGAGAELNAWLGGGGIVIPGFVTAMLVGVLLTNLTDAARMTIDESTANLLGRISLSLFLAMSLVSLELMALADAALPVALGVLLQVCVALLFVRYVVFPWTGRNYDAAVISSGFLGLGLGATPVAMANMEAVEDRFGPSPTAVLTVPLIGAGVLDLANAAIIQFGLDLLM